MKKTAKIYMLLANMFLIGVVHSIPIENRSKTTTPFILGEHYNNNSNADKNTTGPGAPTIRVFDFDVPVAIPDGDVNGIDIPLDLNGFFTGEILDFVISIDIQHTWLGDLEVVLTAPNGISRLVIFSRTGVGKSVSTTGLNTNLNGTYVFTDSGQTDWWSEAFSVGDNDLPSGIFRTSTAGHAVSDIGGCTTRLNGAFKGLPTNKSNGVWTLHVADYASFDEGSISRVQIITEQESDLLYSSGFQFPSQSLQLLPASNILGNCKKAQFDFTGNGLTDYSTAFGYSFENGPYGIQLNLKENDATANGEVTYVEFDFALGNEFPNPVSAADFDGDGIADIVAQINPSLDDRRIYLVQRSSRPNDLPLEFNNAIRPEFHHDFQPGDYDGDGVDDYALFIASKMNPKELAILGIFDSSGGYRDIFTGRDIADNLIPAGGFDHNGDGHDDLFLLTRNIGGSLNPTVYGGSEENLIFETDSLLYNGDSFSIPGKFLDNGNSGLSTLFDFGNGNTLLDIRDENNGLSIETFTFQNAVNDVYVTGDYDGDGKDDVGVWRNNTDGLGHRFIITPTNSDSLFEVEFLDEPFTLIMGNSRIR